MRKSFKKVLSLAMAAAMAVSLGSGFVAPATADALTLKAADNKEVAAFMESGTYNAYLTFQTSMYSYRNPFDDDTTGLTNKDIPCVPNVTTIYENEEKAALDKPSSTKGANAGVSVFDWRKMFIHNSANSTDVKDVEFRDFNADGTKDVYKVPKYSRYIVRTADFLQPDITYDGTYTVSMSGFAENTFQYDYGFRMLGINTNIPITKTDVKFTNVILKIDGVQVGEAMAEGVVRNAGDSPNSYNIMVANEYGYVDYGIKGQKVDENKKDPAADPVWEAAKAANTTPVMPKKSIEITFTVSGLGAAPAGYVPKNDHAIAASTQAIVQQQQQTIASQQAIDAATPSLEVGAGFTAGKFNYKVIKASAQNDGTAEVAVVGLTKAAKKKTSLTVAKTVTNEVVSYKVTTVGKNAFANCKKLKNVTLGANVTTIQKKAFSKCTKLAKLTVKGKLTKVEKKAFAGCKKKIKVAGGNKKAVKANIKALKKSGYKKFK